MTPPCLDATSSLFLGLQHGSASLPAWGNLTTGVPAVLAEPATAGRIGARVARWQGADAGLVARSSLHALMDVLGELPQPGDLVAIDEFAYPITEWAALRAAARGVEVRRYRHHRPARLVPPAGGRLVLVADGWCPGCNRPAPLASLRHLTDRLDGLLVVDDSLAFGVLGHRGPGEWFGDGAGTPAWSGLDHSGVVWVASMAKAYGSPIAVVTSDRKIINRLARDGGNRSHSSPPSSADLAAAAVALGVGVGDQAGDWPRAQRSAGIARHRLLGHVLFLRQALAAAGLRVPALPFPLVSIPLAGADQARRWLDGLHAHGIRAVAQRPRCRPGITLSVLLRADHSKPEVERLAGALTSLARSEAA